MSLPVTVQIRAWSLLALSKLASQVLLTSVEHWLFTWARLSLLLTGTPISTCTHILRHTNELQAAFFSRFVVCFFFFTKRVFLLRFTWCFHFCHDLHWLRLDWASSSHSAPLNLVFMFNLAHCCFSCVYFCATSQHEGKKVIGACLDAVDECLRRPSWIICRTPCLCFFPGLLVFVGLPRKLCSNLWSSSCFPLLVVLSYWSKTEPFSWCFFPVSNYFPCRNLFGNNLLL